MSRCWAAQKMIIRRDYQPDVGCVIAALVLLLQATSHANGISNLGKASLQQFAAASRGAGAARQQAAK